MLVPSILLLRFNFGHLLSKPAVLILLKPNMYQYFNVSTIALLVSLGDLNWIIFQSLFWHHVHHLLREDKELTQDVN